MQTEVYFRKCGRQDSNLHGLPRLPAKSAQGHRPAASKAAAYTNSTTPAWPNSNNYLSGLQRATICTRRSRGFHAAALGASGRDAPIIPAFSLENCPDDLLRSSEAPVVQLVAP